LFLTLIPAPPKSTIFPYTTLFRSPVIYAMEGEDVIVAVDYGEKKLKNLRENPKVSLVVDEYRPNRAVMIQGECEILERGKEYLRSEEHTSELQSLRHLVCRLLLEK